MCCLAAGRSRGRSPRDRPAARQHTRELMSTTHTNPWLIPIITWYVRLFRQKTTSIRVFPLQSPIKVLSNRSHFVLTSSCSRYWTTPQMAPAVLTAKPNSNTNTQGGAVSTLLALRSMCDPRRCKLFVTFSTDCNDNSQHSFKHSTIYLATENTEINHSRYVQCSIRNCSRTTTPSSTWILRPEMLPRNLAWAKVNVKHWIAIWSKRDTRK